MLRVVARELCVRQPSMAGFQTAAAIALAAADPRQALEALAARIRRAPRTIARHAVPLLRLRTPGTSRLRLVTCSRSDAVERTLLALNQVESIDVCCAESRPAREGVALAAALLEAGLSTHLYSDAGLSAAIPGASALVVGADAVSNVGFINKVGTAALAALAQASGVPVLVLAGREKLVPALVFEALVLHADDGFDDRSGTPPPSSAIPVVRTDSGRADQPADHRRGCPRGEGRKRGRTMASRRRLYMSVMTQVICLTYG